MKKIKIIKNTQQFPSKVLTDKCRIKTHLISTELLYEKTKEKGKKCQQFPSEVLTDKQRAKRNEL